MQISFWFVSLCDLRGEKSDSGSTEDNEVKENHSYFWIRSPTGSDNAVPRRAFARHSRGIGEASFVDALLLRSVRAIASKQH